MEVMRLNRDRFLSILRKLVDQTQYLQNNPPEQIPQEDLVADIIVKELEPYSTENNSLLKIEKVSYVSGRSNLIITYLGKTKNTIGFIGSHFDVVPANPSEWKRNPFKLSVESGKIYARGVTDCLGHIALLTDMFIQLAKQRAETKHSIIAVMIANEECSHIRGIGIDKLASEGRIEQLKNGPVYWLDSADSNPTIGSGSVNSWRLTIKGRQFHSGMPQYAINPLEVAFQVVQKMQEEFYRKYPAHKREKEYKYEIPSSCKPTIFKMPPGSVNQIPGECTVLGDIRMTPFYDVEEAMEFLNKTVRKIRVESLKTYGPSKFALKKPKAKAEIKFRWEGVPYLGIACDTSSKGFRILDKAVKAVRGVSKPVSTTGGLPLVKELQDKGFDVQIIGFGREDAYHAPNEYAVVSEFEKGFKILKKIIELYEN